MLQRIKIIQKHSYFLVIKLHLQNRLTAVQTPPFQNRLTAVQTPPFQNRLPADQTPPFQNRLPADPTPPFQIYFLLIKFHPSK